MILRQRVLPGFKQPWSRNRPHNEGDADGIERLWWKRLSGQSGPKTVTIAGHGRESRNLMALNKVVDLAALHEACTWIAAWENPITFSWPWLREPYRKILRVGAHVQGCSRVAPDLPRGS